MGLDAVEIVLRTEELFVIEIEDGETATVRAIGNFYDLVCAKLDLIPLYAPVSSAQLPEITIKEKTFLFLYRHTPLPAPALSTAVKRASYSRQRTAPTWIAPANNSPKPRVTPYQRSFRESNNREMLLHVH